MERIAYAAPGHSPRSAAGCTRDPQDDASSFTAVCDGLTNEHLDRGQVEGQATENDAHSLASLAVKLDELGQLVRKQGISATALEKQHCSVDETAELTGYKPWTIRHACHKGRIKGKKGDDGRWRVPREEVQRIQEAGLPKD